MAREIERHGNIAARHPYNERAEQPALDFTARSQGGAGGEVGPVDVILDEETLWFDPAPPGAFDARRRARGSKAGMTKATPDSMKDLIAERLRQYPDDHLRAVKAWLRKEKKIQIGDMAIQDAYREVQDERRTRERAPAGIQGG